VHFANEIKGLWRIRSWHTPAALSNANFGIERTPASL
jgi:hypothetical protein